MAVSQVSRPWHCVLCAGLPSAWPQLPGEASYFSHFCLPGRSWDSQDLSQVLKATLVGLWVTPEPQEASLLSPWPSCCGDPAFHASCCLTGVSCLEHVRGTRRLRLVS